MDSETGLYYYGARYLDPKYSHWLSPDPAMGKYIPEAPVNDEARKHNQNLPGGGGVFNTVNLQVYHYAGNNPVKYTDPDGNQLAIPIPGFPVPIPIIPVTPIKPDSPARKGILGDDFLMSDTKKSNDQDTSSSQADQAKDSVKDNAQAPASNNGNGKQHGNDDHNKKIDEKVEELKQNENNRDIRKNQQQVDANGNKVGNNRPDVQWTDENGVRHYQEYDHNKTSSENHGKVIKKNDPNGIVHLELLE